MRKAEIVFEVELDDQHLPDKINWKATDSTGEFQSCKSVMLAVWDHQRQNTLRVDLWTKDMPVDEMKRFFYESLMTMADTFERATGEKNITEDLRDYCAHFSEKMKLNQ